MLIWYSAILLGRLRMMVQASIDAFIEIMGFIFERQHMWIIRAQEIFKEVYCKHFHLCSITGIGPPIDML